MEKTKKNLMATIIIAAVILIAGGIGTMYVFNQKDAQIKSLTMQQNDMSLMMQQKDSILNDAESTFDEIENNLTFIKEKRSQIALAQKEGGKTRKQAVIDDIKLMNTMLEESNKKIASLEARLRKSGISAKVFEKRIAALNESIESQNTQIAELKKVIEDKDANLAQLNSKVNDISSQMAQQADTITYKQKQIVDRTNQLNTGHLALGTYKELKDEGILVREGGILGLGASKTIQENFDNKYFTTLDIRDTKTIPLHAKKAKVISEHPDSSYTLVEENGQIAYLQINNPDEFWKISKYAVIEVK